MAVPVKGKTSSQVKKGRGPKSWSFHQKVLNQPLVKCANCQKTKILHRLCPHCSVYRVNSKAK